MKGQISVFAACVLLGAPPQGALAGEFVPDDQVVSNVLVNMIDPEYDLERHRMAWQDTSGNLWIGDIDPHTGDLLPNTGMSTLVDTNLVPLGVTLNGPEWVYGANGDVLIAYTKYVGATLHLAVARQDAAGAWQPQLLPDSANRWRPLGTFPSNTGPARIAYLLEPPGQERLIAWREVDDETSELTLANPTSEGQRWVESEPKFITTIMIDEVRQVVLVDSETAAVEQLTFDSEPKFLPFMWFAPEYGELVFMTMIDRDRIGIYRKVNSQWTNVYTMELPSPKPFFHSPEPFIVNGKSYILTVAAEEIGGVGPFPFQPIGPTEIWITGIDPDNPFFRRVDSPVSAKHRLDPEVFNTSGGPVVYYTQKVDATGGFVLRRAATGLNPEYGYDSGSYGGAWAAMHRDSKNCACTPFLVADEYAASYEVNLPSTQVVRSVMGPNRHLYFPYFDIGGGANTRAFAAYDSEDGTPVFQLSNKFMGGNITAVNAVIDSEGNLYIPAEERLSKITPTGQRLWETPIRGLARSAQIAADGNLILFTWRGWVYVVDPDDGAVLSERNLTPKRVYPATPSCLATGDKSQCSFINAPALDSGTGIVYNTMIDTNGNSVLHAYQYDSSSYDISYLWRRRAPRMPGVASSPVLSNDYSRVYVQDGANQLLAFDALTGEEIWRFDLGYSTAAPPVVTAGGYLMPGGTYADSMAHDSIGIVQDNGNSAQWAFQSSNYRPVSAAAAGAGNRFALVARDLATSMLTVIVVEPDAGIVAASPWGADALTAAPKAVTLREDGWLFVDEWNANAFRAFAPLW